MTPDRDIPRENVHRAGELSRLLDEWDPLGLYEGDDGEPPPGEYSDLVWPIIRMLNEGATAQLLARGIRDAVEANYEVSGVFVMPFAQRLIEWHEANLNP